MVYGYEVCDNYPRGLNLWNIDTAGAGAKRDTKVCYQFKAKHTHVASSSPCTAHGKTWPEWPSAPPWPRAPRRTSSRSR